MLRPTKIINDPVHGFIEIPAGLILALIDHPFLQRLRRIRQLGLSVYVYPGAVHTRFHHALGAMHLMKEALDTLRRKHIAISDAEYEAAIVAILLHDIGHGPFSHGLEHEIIRNVHHEEMSLALMRLLNKEFAGALGLAIEIFTGSYHKTFLHQLVSSQLDMDRMDYLMRDSFFTGVVEGVVGADRIIKTLNVWDNHLVVESKGIYSVENYLLSRRLMYWQVYLHKAALAGENMMALILRRARKCVEEGKDIFLGEMLGYFFRHNITQESLTPEVLYRFAQLDDTDVVFAMKQWQFSSDRVLADLCQRLLNRKLLKAQLQNIPFEQDFIAAEKAKFCQETGYSPEEADYFVFTGSVANQTYNAESNEPIMVWYKNNQLLPLAEASDMQSPAFSNKVVKYFFCKP